MPEAEETALTFRLEFRSLGAWPRCLGNTGLKLGSPHFRSCMLPATADCTFHLHLHLHLHQVTWPKRQGPVHQHHQTRQPTNSIVTAHTQRYRSWLNSSLGLLVELGCFVPTLPTSQLVWPGRDPIVAMSRKHGQRLAMATKACLEQCSM